MSVQENSQYSVDEFEEIERLIQENTAPDSDDEEKDTSAADSTSLKEPEIHVQVDTGYQTVADFGFAQESTDPDTTARDDSRVSESESTISSKSSLRRTTHFKYHSESSGENDEPLTERSATEQEITLLPALTIPDESADDENVESDDNKLVATFGTTENFEALLKQQLEDMDENLSDTDVPQRNTTKEQSQQIRHSTPAPATAKISFPGHRKIHNRTTRSPAANRARKASLNSRTWHLRSHSSGLAESSDDLSVHSEASRHELRQRLRKTHSERKKETNITHQLQSDYDDLLTRFAEAENVIDQLRIGAKIDLFASLPSGGGEQPVSEKRAATYPVHGGPPISSSDLPARGAAPATTTSNSPHVSQTPRPCENVDSMTKNSLKFPTAASTEFLRIALEHQANELRGYMESFKTLLNEVDVADVEKRQVIGQIAKSLQKLEEDYITSGKDHEADQRAMILSGNAIGGEIEEFDPNRKIEGEIYQLRKMLDDLRDNVLLGPSLPQTPVSSQRFQSSDRESDSCISALDLDAGFNEQLRRYNKVPLISDREDCTTASSRNLSSDDDTTIGYPGDATPRKSSVSHNSSGMPERFLRPPSDNDTSPSKSIHHSSGSHAGTGSIRSTQGQSSPNENPDSRHRPRSRLPRPVEPRSQSTGVLPTKKPVGHEMDRDSGFVGSEGSRKSVPTYPLKHDRNLQRLSPVHSTPHTQQPRPVPVQRKPSQQEIRQTKLEPKPVKTTKGPKISTGTMSGYSDREKIGYDDQDSSMLPPSHEAPSYTPPKPFEQKSLRSEDGSSTWSSPLRPRPVTFHGVSGDPMFSTVPVRGHHYQQPAPATVTEKYRPSSKRSATSSSKDSSLDLIRSEIAKLRQEILENKAIADASERNKVELPAPRMYTSESQATESASQRGRRSTRTKDRRRGSRQNSRTSEDSTYRSQDKTAKRDAKTGGDTPITTEQLAQDTNPIADTTNVLNGRWEYVPPYFSPSAVTPVRHMPVTYSSPVHTPFVQLDTPYYSPVRYSSPARIYIPVSPTGPVVYNSIPVEVRTYRRRGSGHVIQASAQTVHMVDENDLPLTRSQLKTPKRSSSVPPLRQSFFDPQLCISLHRAEKASNSLRQKSRSMYKSLRDSYHRAELSRTFA